VRNHIISVDKNGDGFIATYIPKADLAPLMSTVGNNIYIRSGSNNVPAPYSVIAGMFGRRPQPNVELLMGNHEAMLLSCDFLFDEITDESIEGFTGEKYDLLINYYNNGGEVTLKALHALPKETQQDILDYLSNNIVSMTISVP
jgi:hypothetical protein